MGSDWRRAGSIHCVIGVVLIAASTAPSDAARIQDEDARAKVRAAIETIRGSSLDGLDVDGKNALGERLNDAWEVLFEHKDVSGTVVREALAKETEDSFLIIDLSSFLLFLHEHDPSVLEEISGYLLKADPDVYSRSFFQTVSYMSARHCQACLPSIFRILEIRELDGYIVDHALTVDTELGLVFTLAQFGDDVFERIRQALASDSCTVRGNAARALANLDPARIPHALEVMALEDSCPYARAGAWQALAYMRSSKLGALLERRVSSGLPDDPVERRAIAMALSFLDTEFAAKALRELEGSLDEETSDLVKTMASNDLVGAGKTPGSGKPGKRRQIVRALKKAEKKGRYDGPDNPDELYEALTPSDVPLINRARAAVLARLSDECLYEWYPLTATVHALRAYGR